MRHFFFHFDWFHHSFATPLALVVAAHAMADTKRATEYWREVTGRAWTLSKQHFAWAYPLAIGIVVFGLVWWGLGWDKAVENLVPSLFGAGAAVLVAVAIYGCNLARAAAAIHAEQLGRIQALERDLYNAQAALRTKQQNKALADALKAHDDRAVHELWAAKQPLNEYESPKWLAKESAWKTELLEIIRKHGGDDDDVRHLSVLGNLYRPGQPRYHHDDAMNQRLIMLDIRRERIRDVIKKYDPEAY